LQHTVPAMHALVAGGCDLIELGVPFSDPEAEGPAIQASSERALANGVTLRRVLDLLAEFRQQDARTPVVLMGYLNSVLAMSDFAERGQGAGVDGLIVVNLPPEEGGDLSADLARHDIDLIYLVAPTTTQERARMIVSRSRGFVYYVSLKGITGANLGQADDIGEKLDALRRLASLPVCVGFGIKTADNAAAVGAHADGVVVGSALVELMAAHADDVAGAAEALQRAAQELRRGLNGIE
jgi:tryptophan synthase alpha chain